MKLIRLPEVMDRVALRKTAIYKLMSDGDFPRPIKVGAASLWVEEEIDDWICDVAASRDRNTSQQ